VYDRKDSGLNQEDSTRQSTTTVSAHVPVALAEALRAMAAAGNRSVSREIASALREHVEQPDRGTG
jgi:hypothetical protein